MPRIKRGGYIFQSWVGDHSPRHVHVFGKEGLVVKWNLEANVAMQGEASTKIRRLLEQLREEGVL